MNRFSRSANTFLPAALLLIGAGAIAAPPADKMTKDPAAQAAPSTQTVASRNNVQAEFDARDTNRDNFISRDEAGSDKKLISQFNALDANQDDKLSPAEFGNARGLALLTLKADSRDRN
jgi:EF hand